MIDAGAAATRGLAGFLCLAATPTFAVMALLTCVLGGARRMASARPGRGLR